jgi:hypothetical protein
MRWVTWRATSVRLSGSTNHGATRGGSGAAATFRDASEAGSSTLASCPCAAAGAARRFPWACQREVHTFTPVVGRERDREVSEVHVVGREREREVRFMCVGVQCQAELAEKGNVCGQASSSDAARVCTTGTLARRYTMSKQRRPERVCAPGRSPRTPPARPSRGHPRSPPARSPACAWCARWLSRPPRSPAAAQAPAEAPPPLPVMVNDEARLLSAVSCHVSCHSSPVTRQPVSACVSCSVRLHSWFEL